MGLRFSPSTRGFYDTDLHRAMPDDVVPVSPARHAELMKAQAQGAAIVASPNTRKPVIQRAYQDAAARRETLRVAIKREAARRIDAISPTWRQLNDWRSPSDAGAARFAQIDAVRNASHTIELLVGDAGAAALRTFPVRDNPLWPVFEGTG